MSHCKDKDSWENLHLKCTNLLKLRRERERRLCVFAVMGGTNSKSLVRIQSCEFLSQCNRVQKVGAAADIRRCEETVLMCMSCVLRMFLLN